jgi:hypothetical protein
MRIGTGKLAREPLVGRAIIIINTNMTFSKNCFAVYFALISFLPSLVESSLRVSLLGFGRKKRSLHKFANNTLRNFLPFHQARDLTVCDTLKACYLVNIQTRKETELDGSDAFELDPLNDAGYSVRCDVSGDASMDFIKFFYEGVVPR